MKNIAEIEITDLSHDGRGVGRTLPVKNASARIGNGLNSKSKSGQGKACFVAGALPGEKVSWKKTNSKRSFDEGVLVDLIKPSDKRVHPKCTYYDECGGCQLQHFDSSAQIEWKQDQLKQAVVRADFNPKNWLPALSRDFWNYRRRSRLAVQFEKDGQVVIGYRKKKSKALVKIDRCEVLDESLNHIFPLLISLARLLKKSGITEFELTKADSAIAICAYITKSANDGLQGKLSEKLELFDSQDEIQLWQKRPKERAEPISSKKILYSAITDKTKMSFIPGQFLQVNSSMNQAMVAQSLELAQPSKKTRVLDLFCGAGNFSLAFAEHCEHVFGVEGSSELCHQAATNAQEQGYSNTEFQMADLSKIDQLSFLQPQDIDLVVLDPPRTGALNLIPWILKLNADKILYISCHPATMVRDVSLLKECYEVDSIGVMDMFPHTAHLEAMLLLTRK